MTRGDFKRLSRLRLQEATLLVKRKRFAPGAYYLAGYAVECGLKACIAKKTRQYEFPDRDRLRDAYVHNLTKLVSVADLQPALDRETRADRDFDVNWTTVKDWTEESRYDAAIDTRKAQSLITAISDPRHGVMRWIHRFW